MTRPQHFAELLSEITRYQDTGRNLDSLVLAQRAAQQALTQSERLTVAYLLTRGFMQCGDWQQASRHYQECQEFLESMLVLDVAIDPNILLLLPAIAALGFYFGDRPSSTHALLARIGKYCGQRICSQDAQPSRPPVSLPLKIGYLSECFRRHSVGWLSRWLLAYHDRDRFAVHAYSLVQSEDDIQRFIVGRVQRFHQFSLQTPVVEAAAAIARDKIDILIDLDSLTSSHSYAILALKPAPLQVTWLGSDASGLPTIDYFLADPFVLPDDAQQYYAAKIERLPQTYIAVDGFEVGTPTLRRDRLGIPDDAVVYLTSQSAYKRHPDTIRLQLQILRAVPSGVLAIKGGGERIQDLFQQAAAAEGVAGDRLYFLPIAASEETHRANLGLADIVLDTYPYNGATTTLETLWMGIPLVTRVGEQFAARNSYTMLTNVGVTEGIARSDAEYVDWGVRFGVDGNLRRHVAWQLRASRQTAPLWCAKTWTRQMEELYLDMWTRYVES